jgi:hypothetical protein
VSDVVERARREAIIHKPRMEGRHCACGSTLPCITLELLAEVERLREVVQSTTDLYHEAAQEARTAKGDLEVAVVSLSFANDAVQRVRDLRDKAFREDPGQQYAVIHKNALDAALDGEQP